MVECYLHCGRLQKSQLMIQQYFPQQKQFFIHRQSQQTGWGRECLAPLIFSPAKHFSFLNFPTISDGFFTAEIYFNKAEMFIEKPSIFHFTFFFPRSHSALRGHKSDTNKYVAGKYLPYLSKELKVLRDEMAPKSTNYSRQGMCTQVSNKYGRNAALFYKHLQRL